MKLFISIAILSLTFCLAFAQDLPLPAENSAEQEVSKIIALVNNEVVTTKDLTDFTEISFYQAPDKYNADSYVSLEYRKQALNELIDNLLILDYAKKEQEAAKDDDKKKFKFEVDQRLVEKKLAQIVNSTPDVKAFEESLKARGVTINILRNKIQEQYLIQLAIDKYVRSYIDVSAPEVSRYYYQHLKDMISLPRYKFCIAADKQPDQLQEIAALIAKEGIAAALAKFSDDFSEMESTLQDLRNEIASEIKTLTPNEHKIFASDQLNYLIYLREIVPAQELSLTDATETVMQKLWQMKFDLRLKEWISGLRRNAAIKIFPPYADEAADAATAKIQGVVNATANLVTKEEYLSQTNLTIR